MFRLLQPAVVACLVAAVAIAVAQPAADHSASAHAESSSARKLTRKVATEQIRQFLASATQVTGLPGSFFVGTCERRSARVLDCSIVVPGQARGVMRARLFGGSRTRVQLYVLEVTRI